MLALVDGIEPHVLNLKTVLEKYLEENKVKVFLNSEIVDVVKKGKKITKIVLTDKEIIAKKYILCTGGKSYSITGSNGAGYVLAEKLGHTIVNPMPALSPIELKEDWIKNIQGISMENVRISVFSREAGSRHAGQNGKKQFSEEGEFIFTHFGISGPAVLNISGKVANLLKNGEVKICFDFFPLLNHEKLVKKIDDVLNKSSQQIIKNILTNFVPERLSEILLKIVGIEKEKIGNSISKIDREKIVKVFKNFEVTAKGVYSFDQALVTRGGISLKEIDHKTMKSKIIDNLFFAGEIIDVDGKSGGFNLQMCWSTGYVAGKSSADKNISK